jgi:hypothetical protein
MGDIRPPVDGRSACSALGRVLRYATAVVRDIDALSGELPDDSGKLERFVDKVIAEAALLVLIAARADDTSLAFPRDEIDELASELRPRASSERNAVMMMRFPHSVATLGFAHIALQAVGFADGRFDKIVRSCLATGEVEAMERVPFRSMELNWQLDMLGLEPKHGLGTLTQSSVLGSLPNPCFSVREQAYQLTHALMYATDFGRAPERVHDRLPSLVATIEVFLAWTTANEDFDLVGELLLALESVRAPWMPAAQVASHQVWGAWRALGHLPDVNYDARHADRLAGSSKRAYALRHTYHPVFVLGLLSALIAARPEPWTADSSLSLASEDAEEDLLCSPRLRLAERCDVAAARADRFLIERTPQAVRTKEAIVAGEGQDVPLTAEGSSGTSSVPIAPGADRPVVPPSLRAGAAAAAVDPEAEAVFLLDCALMCAVKSYDLVTIALRLADAMDRSPLPSSTVVAAIAFLSAQQLPSGVIGLTFLPDANEESALASAVTQILALTLRVSAEYLRTNFSPADLDELAAPDSSAP